MHSSSQDCATSQVSLAITSFVSHGQSKVPKFLSNLERFVSPRGTGPHLRHTQISSEDISNDLIESPEEYPADVNGKFYTTLSKHLPCECPSSEIPSEHCARLRLGATVRVVQGDVQFDMLFSAQPTSPCVPEIRWQQLRFHIPRYNHFLVST